MTNNSKDGLLKNISWKFAERISAQIVTTIVSIVLARVLDPAHYGLITIVLIYITIANVFVSDGFGSALIQKKNTDALDFFSVLYFNLAFSIVLCIILWVLAPLITKFYGKGYELLTPILRVLSFRIILSAINSVQQSYVAKKMEFRKFFFATLTGTVVSAIVGIAMAYSGFGVWSLVAQYLTNTTVDTAFLYFTIGKTPKPLFSLDRLKLLLPFGTKVLGLNLLITLFEEYKALLIGKLFSAQDLAFYDKGKQFPSLIINNINSSLSSVLFPKMSNDQNDRARIKATMKQSIRTSSYLLCPMMIGLAVVSGPFVEIVLTEKWLSSVPLLRCFCIAYLFMPIHSANMQAIKALGEGRTFLIVEISKKIIELIALIISIRFGVLAIAISIAICNTFFVAINAFPNKKLINYGLAEQLKDMLPGLMMSIIMGGIVFLVSYIPMPQIVLLILQVIIGAIVYVGLSIITKNKEFSVILNILKKLFHIA